jgi:hypothetical protein
MEVEILEDFRRSFNCHFFAIFDFFSKQPTNTANPVEQTPLFDEDSGVWAIRHLT